GRRLTRYDYLSRFFFFFFQAEDGIRDRNVTGVQTCALPIFSGRLVMVAIDRRNISACGYFCYGLPVVSGFIPGDIGHNTTVIPDANSAMIVWVIRLKNEFERYLAVRDGTQGVFVGNLSHCAEGSSCASDQFHFSGHGYSSD